MIKKIKINWNEARGGQKWFIEILPEVLNEIFIYNEVSESFYDTNKFHMDKDYNGNIYNLRSTADHLTRSEVLYQPKVIKKKQDMILACMVAKNKKNWVY